MDERRAQAGDRSTASGDADGGLVARLKRSYPLRLGRAYGQSHAGNYAAGLAFNAFMSMFPLILGLLAILEAGAAYVPLDPGYPGERLAFMAEDSGLAVVLSQRVTLVEVAGYFMVVVASLGVGIGVNTAVFSWVQAVILRPVPGVTDASSLRQIETTLARFDTVSSKEPDAATARSINSMTASFCLSLPSGSSPSLIGSWSGGMGTTCSPDTCSGSRLVVTTRTPGAVRRTSVTSWAVASRRCSQLSRRSSNCLSFK